MEVIDKKFVSLNNLMTRLRKKKSPPEGLLLLFPHCIQNSKCKQNIKHDINECVRCGKCLRICPTGAITMRKAEKCGCSTEEFEEKQNDNVAYGVVKYAK